MKIIIVLFAFFAFAFADIWSNCGSAVDDIIIKGVKITPDPPVIGQEFTVQANGTLSTSITGGTFFIDVLFGQVTLLNNTFQFCEIVDELKQQCPLKPGPLDLKFGIKIPGNFPPGTYSGIAKASDQNTKPVLCIKFDFTLKQSVLEEQPAKPQMDKFKKKLIF